ncbi:hypothetical protein ACFL27_24210 [candidate division CSSED10-310 bacterium]|uniref:Tetratricopeptide repeat protein n=1 Tax=candidate division CSSED10-310 bacterium TaxID=2855610 RepID=A0ABV6Z4D9_UNCC1
MKHFLDAATEFISEIKLNQEVRENITQIERMLTRGKELFQEGLYEECIEKMMSILSIDPSHEEAVVFIKKANELKD